ncbi:hypothetical protein FOV23_16640 [Salmonella enterica]|nr:hypothetical protein [Salmonella enterica]ECF6498490.1 hypothetical protein [Salmonella enterica]EDF1090368.1 hypothetical protein [Salmonella enterica subsp. enterica serovar Enteritidis]EHW9754627.1 hypothetical protein [Escherichia coli]
MNLEQLFDSDIQANQERFRELVSRYPTLYALWDWERKELKIDAFRKALGGLSSGEYIMAVFFARIWLGKTEEYSYNIIGASFDFVNAAKALDSESLLIIADFFKDPFFP